VADDGTLMIDGNNQTIDDDTQKVNNTTLTVASGSGRSIVAPK
jgi:hypothetical protein